MECWLVLVKCRWFIFLKTYTSDVKYRYFEAKSEYSHLLHQKLAWEADAYLCINW